MANQFQYDVFLSYSRADQKVVHKLADRLKRDELRIWLDEWSIPYGSSIEAGIKKGVKESRVFLLCMSRNYAKSKWSQWEQTIARFRDPTNEDIRYIPLRLDNSEVDEAIRPFRYIDYRPGKRRRAYPKILAACSPPSPKTTVDSGASLPLDEQFVRPLHVAENRYLQLLLSSFTIVRKPKGFELRLSFTDDTLAIWDQSGKRHLRQLLPKEKRLEYQKKFDRFLLDGTQKDPELAFRDDRFVFRYGSGGTLPIISFRGGPLAGEYYCLFYRDVHPIGWNIANGGTDSRAELFDPQRTIERELREEIIIADFRNEQRYVFKADKRKPIDHPAHMVARRLWAKFSAERKFDAFKAKDIRIRWIEGPDSIRVNEGTSVGGLFLNINGEDFGIEVDRVAKIRLPGNVTLFDGEIDGAHLVNAPVGLFEVERFDRHLKAHGGKMPFRPDHFFLSAALYRGNTIDIKLVDSFIPHITKFREQNEIDYLRRCIEKNRQFGLCPVTERIIRRYRHMGA